MGGSGRQREVVQMKTLARQSKAASIIGVLLVVIALLIAGSGCRREAAEPATTPTPRGTTTAAVEPEAEEHEAVPAEYASLTNPVEPGDESIATGKALYDEYCIGCHGASGRGDGPKAATLDHTPADFTDPHMAEEMTDAAFFWRISEGVEDEDMPAWKEKLSEEDRWQLVNFVRTFAPAEAEEAAESKEAPSAEPEH